jgi:hypothetical protein
MKKVYLTSAFLVMFGLLQGCSNSDCGDSKSPEQTAQDIINKHKDNSQQNPPAPPQALVNSEPPVPPPAPPTEQTPQQTPEQIAKSKIAELEQKLSENPDKFDWGIHNDLRHHYGAVDQKKSVQHCDIIFKNVVMDGYILDCLGARDPDKEKAIALLLGWTEKYPEFVFVKAACWLKAGELTSDQEKGRELFQKVSKLEGTDLDPYRKKAEELLKK